ncbi:MAG: hypothetical protein SFY69_06185 [Planctomycetota bacterium]|nr:hypothetical protein [Planctomycetota bacterium]
MPGDDVHGPRAQDAISDDALARLWLAAARDPRVGEALDAIEAMIEDQVGARNPACWGSGRCCAFEQAGHRLYTTGLEAARTIVRLPPGVLLTRDALDGALARGDCPFLTANLCGVHLAKPGACRVYFCDRSAQDWQHELAERVHEAVRRAHDRFGVAYRYAEWRALLGMFVPA